MGTNYYLHEEECPTCGHCKEPKHIGKSSGGWCFSLHVIPEEGIKDLNDWVELWSTGEVVIRDEYGGIITPDELYLVITERLKEQRDWDDILWWDYYYKSEEEFHAKNHSLRGPNGLLRHAIGGRCIAHGGGTWDLIVGEFS